MPNIVLGIEDRNNSKTIPPQEAHGLVKKVTWGARTSQR